jgi:hypothetical protein
MTRTLGIVIVVLALLDGLIHLFLVLFVTHGITSRPPISDLFFLCFVGYVALVVAFLLVRSATLSLQCLVDAVLIVYPIVALAAWIYFTKGRGNPFGLAEISKPAEVILAVVTIVHLIQLGRQEQPGMARSHA